MEASRPVCIVNTVSRGEQHVRAPVAVATSSLVAPAMDIFAKYFEELHNKFGRPAQFVNPDIECNRADGEAKSEMLFIPMPYCKFLAVRRGVLAQSFDTQQALRFPATVCGAFRPRWP
eukprot:2875794-Karenia_brevis.AAC.1